MSWGGGGGEPEQAQHQLPEQHTLEPEPPPSWWTPETVTLAGVGITTAGSIVVAWIIQRRNKEPRP